MPEGPEICITSQFLLSKLKGCTFLKLEVKSGKYMRLQLKGKNFLDGINKYVLKDIQSKGKIMWFKLKNKEKGYLYIISQFGLTGEWSFEKSNNPRLVIQIENIDKTLDLYYYDNRNFGNIYITDNKDDLDDKIDNLAPDLLQTEFTDDTFNMWIKKYLEKSKKRSDTLLGKLLMIQDKKKGIGSGIGNYLAAEIMYNAKLSPHRKIGSLTQTEITTLCHSIKYIIKLSYYNNTIGYMTSFGSFSDVHKKGIDEGDFPNFHKDIKLKKSDKFEFKVYGLKKDLHGNNVTADTTINKDRTTWWVPNVQH